MITRTERLLQNETLTAANLPSNTYISRPISLSTETAWILSVLVSGSFAGTTSGITFEVDLNDNSGGFTRVGAALTQLTAAGLQVTAYYTGTTQGAIIPSYSAAHTYAAQVKATFGNADNVVSGVTVDLIAIG